MEKKIVEFGKKHENEVGHKIRRVPMPTTGYLVRDHEIDALPESKKRLLDKKEILLYLAIVGMLIWLQGYRLDIIFAVLYLSWNTKSPRQHHLDMAYYLIGYLNLTKDMPLVLGGTDKPRVTVYWDSSLGTGPKSKSITGTVTKLGEKSGAISAKSSAQTSVKLSSFEAELDGATTAIKKGNSIQNIMSELGIPTDGVPKILNDNQATLDFIRGDSVAKGVRHMELRMWYTKLEHQMGKHELEYMEGTLTPADKLTKLGNITEHIEFATNIQGLGLLDYDYFKTILPQYVND